MEVSIGAGCKTVACAAAAWLDTRTVQVRSFYRDIGRCRRPISGDDALTFEVDDGVTLEANDEVQRRLPDSSSRRFLDAVGQQAGVAGCIDRL